MANHAIINQAKKEKKIIFKKFNIKSDNLKKTLLIKKAVKFYFNSPFNFLYPHAEKRNFIMNPTTKNSQQRSFHYATKVTQQRSFHYDIQSK